MKKSILTTAALIGAILMTTGCNNNSSTPNVESQQYTTYGRYYTNICVDDIEHIGAVETEDGNVWGYSTDTVSDIDVYNGMPVWVAFDDNGTPNDIYDDTILGLVYDRNTAIYDALETALSDKFELEREGNNIHIITNVETTESGTLYTFEDGTGYYIEK